MGWKFIGMGRGFDGREEEMMERELEKAYREGLEEGRREGRYGYGERGGSGSGSGSGRSGGSSGGSSGGYGQRDNMYYMDEDMEEEYEYGERRGVKGTGPYSRYRYRRR